MIYCDNVLEKVKSYSDFEFNLIFWDPPYNLSTQWVVGDDGKPEVKGILCSPFSGSIELGEGAI